MHPTDREELSWRTSSYSGGGNGGCVAMARLPDAIAVRDSKNPTGPVLTFPPTAWQSLTRHG